MQLLFSKETFWETHVHCIYSLTDLSSSAIYHTSKYNIEYDSVLIQLLSLISQYITLIITVKCIINDINKISTINDVLKLPFN